MSVVLPETGFLRLKQIIGDKHANPPIPALIPVAQSTWWAGVRAGKFPQPIRLSKGCTVWRISDLRALLENPPTEPVSRPAKAQAVRREKVSGRYASAKTALTPSKAKGVKP